MLINIDYKHRIRKVKCDHRVNILYNMMLILIMVIGIVVGIHIAEVNDSLYVQFLVDLLIILSSSIILLSLTGKVIW